MTYALFLLSADSLSIFSQRSELLVSHTGQRADHGECSESASQTLTTHDGGGVGCRQDPRQPKQTALENCTEGWGGTKDKDTDDFVYLKRLRDKQHCSINYLLFQPGRHDRVQRLADSYIQRVVLYKPAHQWCFYGNFNE